MAVTTDEKTYLVSTFFVGDSQLGINTARVQEVVLPPEITPLHHAPEYILGIINLRGRIVTIFDLSRRLALTRTADRAEERIIIVKWKNEHVGLVVDRVADVINTEREKIMPPPPNVKGAQGKYFEGVYQPGGSEHLIAFLDVDKVLAEDEK